MSIKVKINEKEQLNELLGTLLAWGIIATLIGKLLGFKFNLQSDDQMTKWGIGLGDAFNISRQRLRNSGMPADQRERVDRILSTADRNIRSRVQTEAERLRAGGARSTDIDLEITRICDTAVSDISRIIKDRRHAEEYVAPLRATFDELNRTLDSTRREAAIRAFARDPDLPRHIEAALSRGGRRVDPALATAVRDAIATRVAAAMGATTP